LVHQAASQAFVNAVTISVSYDSRSGTGEDLDKFLQHDPQLENWARLKESNDVLVSMQDARPFLQSLRGDTFFVTDSDMMGTGPAAMQAGDHVCLLFGENVLFVLRFVGEHYKFVGSCCI
jgi:hypothetical protein